MKTSNETNDTSNGGSDEKNSHNKLPTKSEINSHESGRTVTHSAKGGSAAVITDGASSENAPLDVESPNASKSSLSFASTSQTDKSLTGVETSLPLNHTTIPKTKDGVSSKSKEINLSTTVSSTNSSKRKSDEINPSSINNADSTAKRVKNNSLIEPTIPTTQTAEESSLSDGAIKQNKNIENKTGQGFGRIKMGATNNEKTENEKKDGSIVSSSVKNENGIHDGEIVSQYTNFPPLKVMKEVRPLKPLTTSERIQLEKLFEISKRKSDGRTWGDDWLGAIDLCNMDVPNPDGRVGERQKRRPLIEWVGLNTKVSSDKNQSSTNNSLKLLNNLLRHVYSYKKVPEQAKLILANVIPTDPKSIGDSIQRLSIDPVVLQQDGWTTTKAKEPQGASGGAYRIGERIWWQGYPGVVIAFVHDDDYGDLWRALWVEDLATFDLEREELEDSRKKYERKKALSTERKKKQEAQKVQKSDFHVDGIEHGIVLASSYARGARHSVFWPARVMHASELSGYTGRRNKSKKIDVVFLAPYWNSDQALASTAGRRSDPLSDSMARHGEVLFRKGPLFEVESIDANASCIQSYPYDAQMGLDKDALRATFKFMGLPKAVFPRFLDSQRMALGLKTFSQIELKSTLASDSDQTSAALLEGHPLAVQTAHFPASVLQLPFVHILSQLPHHERQTFPQPNPDIPNTEPALRFDKILSAMKPPICWGLSPGDASKAKETPLVSSFIKSPITFVDKNNGTASDPYNTGRFLDGLESLKSLLSEKSATSRMLKNSLNELVGTFTKKSSLQELHPEAKRRYTKSLNRTWMVVKSKGENLILAALKDKKYITFLKDWRRCCERIFKHVNVALGSEATSFVITDSRCNLHLTSSECVERAVRLPAALKGVKQAKGNIEIINSIEDAYLNLAENVAIVRAHKMSYVERIKKKCMAAPADNVVALTDDSDGNGGEDTSELSSTTGVRMFRYFLRFSSNFLAAI